MFSDPHNILRQCGVSLGSVVGDFGTGSGAYARALAALVGEKGTVYAFDVQKELITALGKEIAGSKEQVIHPLWVDLEAPRGSMLGDATLDLAVVANLLFQIEHKEGFMREVTRVLRPGGRLLLIDWKESFGNIGPHKDHVVSEARAKELARDAGLSLDRSIEAGAHHYGFTFRKPL